MRPSSFISDPHRRVTLVLIVAVLAISSAGVLVRAIGGVVPEVSIAFWRTTIVAIILAPFASKLSLRDTGLTLLSGGLLAGHFVAWFTAIDEITIMRATVLVCTAPMWPGIIELLIFREKPHSRYWIGLLIALGGIIIMSSADTGEANFKGDLYAALGGFLGALYLIVGRSVRQRVNIQSYACWVCVAAALWLLPTVFITQSQFWGFSAHAWIFIFALAAGPQMLGHNGFNYALKTIKASTVSTLMLLEPVGAAALALLIFGEVPTGQEVLGAVLAVVGVFVATWNTNSDEA